MAFSLLHNYMDYISKYIKNIINNLITKGLSTTIAFIMTLILGRILGVENYGLYSFYIIVANLLIQYGHMGILNSTFAFRSIKYKICIYILLNSDFYKQSRSITCSETVFTHLTNERTDILI